jgi:hypothetical protein
MPKVAIAPNVISSERRPILPPEFLEACPYDHTPNAETIAAIQQAHDMRDGKIPEIRFDSFEDFIKDLESEDCCLKDSIPLSRYRGSFHHLIFTSKTRYDKNVPRGTQAVNPTMSGS